MDREKVEVVFKKLFIYLLHTAIVGLLIAILVGVALEIAKRV